VIFMTMQQLEALIQEAELFVPTNRVLLWTQVKDAVNIIVDTTLQILSKTADEIESQCGQRPQRRSYHGCRSRCDGLLRVRGFQQNLFFEPRDAGLNWPERLEELIDFAHTLSRLPTDSIKPAIEAAL